MLLLQVGVRGSRKPMKAGREHVVVDDEKAARGKSVDRGRDVRTSNRHSGLSKTSDLRQAQQLQSRSDLMSVTCCDVM